MKNIKKQYDNYNGCCSNGNKCCNAFGCDPRHMKHFARRHLRRKNKQELKNNSEEE